MLSVLIGILGISLVFTFIIAIHEFGHLIFMKIFGVKVFKYSICFGKPLISKKIGETEYSLGWIPLGGYVKPLSEESALSFSVFGAILLVAWLGGKISAVFILAPIFFIGGAVLSFKKYKRCR